MIKNSTPTLHMRAVMIASALGLAWVLAALLWPPRVPEMTVTELLANAERWNGKVVCLKGYAITYGIGQGRVWASSEEAAMGLLAPSIRLGVVERVDVGRSWRRKYRGAIKVYGRAGTDLFDQPAEVEIKFIQRLEFFDEAGALLPPYSPPPVPEVTVEGLTMDPQAWDGREVCLTGYAVVESVFEGQALVWSSQEQAAKHEFAPSIKMGSLVTGEVHRGWRKNYHGRIKVHGDFEIQTYDTLHQLKIEQVRKVEYFDDAGALLPPYSPPLVTVEMLAGNPQAWDRKDVCLTGYLIENRPPEEGAEARVWSSLEQSTQGDSAPCIKVSHLSDERSWKDGLHGRLRLCGEFQIHKEASQPDLLALENIYRLEAAPEEATPVLADKK